MSEQGHSASACADTQPVADAGVSAFVREYEFRGESDYTPSDDERSLIEDAIHGFLAERDAVVRDALERVADGSMTVDGALAYIAKATASPDKLGGGQ